MAMLLLFFASPHLLILLDPTAGVFDSGVLQNLVVAMVYCFGGTLTAWLGLAVSFGVISRYVDLGGLRDDFRELSAWHRVAFFALVWLSFIVLFAACLLAVPRG